MTIDLPTIVIPSFIVIGAVAVAALVIASRLWYWIMTKIVMPPLYARLERSGMTFWTMPAWQFYLWTLLHGPVLWRKYARARHAIAASRKAGKPILARAEWQGVVDP